MIDGLSNFFPFYSSDFGQSQLNSKVVEFILLLYIQLKIIIQELRFVAHRLFVCNKVVILGLGGYGNFSQEL